MALETYGIRHIHLLVADHARSVAFYETVFGMKVSFRDKNILFLSSPGGRDSLALHVVSSPDELAKVGQQGGY